MANGRGGSRPGSGRKRQRSEGREWIRALVDDPQRREKFRECLDHALSTVTAEQGVAAFLRAFEHGYGRPPQALEVSGPESGPIIHAVTCYDGNALPPGVTGLPDPDALVGGAD